VAGATIALYAAIPPRPITFQLTYRSAITGEVNFPRESQDASIPVVVSIVMVPMMVPVPAIFVRVTIMAVAVSVVIVRSVWLVSGVNVNAEPIVCFGFGGC
jgi:hypothetical protein